MQKNGATLDVANLGWLKGKTEELHREIVKFARNRANSQGLKPLTDAEKRLAAEICMDAGVAFWKQYRLEWG